MAVSFQFGENCVFTMNYEKLKLIILQACKVEDLGQVNFDEEVKTRFKMVYVPNWFNVDLKTGVSK